jgi:hypothetical protein
MNIYYGAIIPMPVYTIKQVERYFKDNNINIKGWIKKKIFGEYILKNMDFSQYVEGYYDETIHNGTEKQLEFLISCNLVPPLLDAPCVKIDNLDHVFIGYDIPVTKKLISLYNSPLTKEMKELRDILDSSGFNEFIIDFYLTTSMDLDTDVEGLSKI